MSEKNKILLVDDEPGVRESVQAYLEYGDDLEVQVAGNANEAYKLLEKETPDLIISDIMMPEIDGYQFLQTIRQDSRFQDLPVVFLTARGMTGDRIEGYNAG
jgi:CheY-like chemotaxis protein